MTKNNVLLSILVVCFLVSIISLVDASEVNEVSIGIYILNLGKFDISTGSFTADFYMSMTCSKNCSEQDFEFANG